ncbi:Carboxy-terminal processing protease CtpA [bioreactor metagenome]|uniref:Carboxy-terminal processing protease CtpA n=1 Tax=bioreactor metagenome TaxID=1076179 RepID=A0A645HIF9_9ZZZZ
MKYSKAIWLTPNRVKINQVGLVPDVTVLLHPVLSMALIDIIDDEAFIYDQVDNKIATAQNCLDFLGYDLNRFDGYFDQSTVAAIKAFQSDYGLNQDGVLNSETASLLCTEVVREWNNNNEQYDTQKAKAIELLNE